jgi:prophage regulatory protein
VQQKNEPASPVTLVGGFEGLRKRGIRWTRQHLGRLERRGEFPKRVRIGPNTVDWVAEEIDAWLAARAAEREPPEPPQPC